VTDQRLQAPFRRRLAPVTARELHGPYVVLHCADPDGPRPRPGQFYMLATASRWGGGAGERPFLPRAFSVLRAPPGSDRLQFLIEDVGPGTNRLCELVPGDGLLLLGPLGVGFRPPRGHRRPLLVGGGVGIAPLAIWSDVLGAGTTTLLGFRDAAHAAGAALIPGALIATDDGGVGHHGLVTDLLREQLEDRAGADAAGCLEVYACGPPAMLEAVRAICAQRQVPGQLALESGMACGFGACFGCVVPTRGGYLRLCLDGPVLDADALESVPGTVHTPPVSDTADTAEAVGARR
jgi:NAD(P)H-flavin reductase